MIHSVRAAARLPLILAALALPAAAQVVPPAGYIYSTQLLGSPTQNCLAHGPGGVFVGVGPGFTPNAQAVVLVKPSGDARLVAFGFSSIGGCAYDGASDTLYVTDNAAAADFGVSPFLVPSGDTVFSIPSASTAAALLATDIELLPSGSIPFAASVALAANGDVLVGDAAGGGNGAVVHIDTLGVATPLIGGLDFTGGIAVDPQTGDIFVAEFLAGFDNRISRYTAAGAPVTVPLVGPTFDVGSNGLLLLPDGSLIATGLFFGDVVAVDPAGPSTIPFISGLTFATGATVDPFTERITLLSSSFSGADEDKSLHHFTPVERLTPGTGAARTECLHELYGIELVAAAPGRKPTKAICVDGAACDADGQVNGECLFPIGACLNVLDLRFPECDRSEALVEFSAVARPASVGLRTLVAAVQEALPLPGLTPSCFFGDGVTVPLRSSKAGLKSGKAKVTVAVRTASGVQDRDSFGLVCEPAVP